MRVNDAQNETECFEILAFPSSCITQYIGESFFIHKSLKYIDFISIMNSFERRG
jgi:hypothetical protein